MLNHICIMGRLTRDPELRYTQSNTPVVSFTVACDRDYTQQGLGLLKLLKGLYHRGAFRIFLCSH